MFTVQQSDLLSTIYSKLIETDTTSDNSMLDSLADIICDLFDESDKANVYYFSMPIWDYLHNCWKKPTIARINLANEKEEVIKQFEYDNWKNWICIKDKVENRYTEKFDHTTYIGFFSKASKGFSFIEFFTQRVKTISPVYTIQFSEISRIEYNKNTGILSCPRNIGEEKFKEDFIKQTKNLLTEGDLNEKQKVELDAFRIFLSEYKTTFIDLKYIYLISSRLYRQDDNAYIGSGGVILVCKESIDNTILQQISILTNLCYRELGGKNWAEKCRQESIKSAKAAIMSRNLSHNLGSHVMSYLKQSLKSVSDMERYGALEEMSPKGQKLPKSPELPYLVGTGRFISYLQERQDYIATVSTDYIPYPSVVNFKDCIYDELNPDYRFQRHNKEWVGYKPANILLENIARSEGLSRQSGVGQVGNNIVIKYRRFNGLNKNEAEDDYNSLRKWNFSLPGGVMGRQAVFSIVENIIRNAAKHGKRDDGQDLIVTFDILDPFKDGFNDRIKSFGEGFLERYSSKINDCGYAKDINDLYVVTLTTNTKAIIDNDNSIIKTIRDAIHESLVDDRGYLKKSNKGIKEMVISAAWLRNLRIEEIDEKTRKEIAPILRVCTDKDGNLQYVFCVPRVKEVALVVKDDQNGLLQKKNDNTWISNGWHVFTLEEYKSLASKNFNFVILDKDLSERKEEVRKCSTNRFFIEAEETDLKEQKIQFSMANCSELGARRDFEKHEKELYKQLANEDDDFVIAISDESNRINVDSTHVVDVQKLVNKENDLSDFRFVYRKHNDTKEEFGKFVNIYRQGADWAELEFVEGITGGNSTDRLIRHAVLDDVWAYKHLHAMKTKVAIFDERLFANTSGIELSDLQSAKKDWDGMLEGMSVEEARKTVKDYDNKHDELISEDKGLRVSFRKYSKDDILRFATTTYSNNNVFPVSEISSVVCHKKKIDLFTFTKTKNGVIIWGGNFGSNGSNGCYGCIEAVGKIVFDNENGKPRVKRYVGFRTKYDYISLHQGLLDKVYEALPPNTDNETNRLAVTKAIYKEFLSSDNNDEDYLQGMVIHSGRSKPNEKDMPQHQPFLQYSAIENALFDCKYSLVEVFDFACFDKTNEN